jgi:hypothetical protein
MNFALITGTIATSPRFSIQRCVARTTVAVTVQFAGRSQVFDVRA